MLSVCVSDDVWCVWDKILCGWIIFEVLIVGCDVMVCDVVCVVVDV